MTLLVVGNHQAVRLGDINLTQFDEGLLFLYCSPTTTPGLKVALKRIAYQFNVPFYVCFAVPQFTQPPVRQIPTELLVGFGKTISDDVVIYNG